MRSEGTKLNYYESRIAKLAVTRLKEWLGGRPPQPEATGFFKLRKKKEETPIDLRGLRAAGAALG